MTDLSRLNHLSSDHQFYRWQAPLLILGNGEGCFEFDTIYTDGSWKESSSMKEFLSGKREIVAGGAVVLRKGDKYFPIYVEMVIELDSAFEAELISLLIAIAMARDTEVDIYSDCKSALEVLKGKI